MITGTIRSLRVDKGFGFIKDEQGQELLSSTKARSTAKGSTICARATPSSSRSATDRRGRAPRAFAARRPRRRASQTDNQPATERPGALRTSHVAWQGNATIDVIAEGSGRLMVLCRRSAAT